MIPVTVADMLSKCQDPVCAKFDRFGSKLSDLEKTSASMSSHHEEDPQSFRDHWVSLAHKSEEDNFSDEKN